MSPLKCERELRVNIVRNSAGAHGAGAESAYHVFVYVHNQSGGAATANVPVLSRKL